MNQEAREALIEKATQRIVAGLHQTTDTEQMMIRAALATYGLAMYAAGNRNAEEWIGRMFASLPIPIVITRTEHEPVLACHWQTQDVEGDGVTFAYGLEQALTHLMHQQRPS